MIQKVEMYQAVCDGCGKRIRPQDENPNDVLLLVTALHGWKKIDGKLYCPNCVEWDEETDSYKPKEKE